MKEQWLVVPGTDIEASSRGRIRVNGTLTNAKQIRGIDRHRLIARAWLGPPLGRIVVRRRGRSNAPSNLYYCPRSLFYSRLARPCRGERHGQHRLTAPAVRHIRESDESIYALAERFGVWPQTIWLARTRQTWRHVR